jgi:hypothetical protein
MYLHRSTTCRSDAADDRAGMIGSFELLIGAWPVAPCRVQGLGVFVPDEDVPGHLVRAKPEQLADRGDGQGGRQDQFGAGAGIHDGNQVGLIFPGSAR